MNYCDKIHYNIYTTGLATFGEMVDALLAQLPQDEQILRLAFFGMPNDNEQYVSRRIMLREKIRKFYGNHEPVLSYVSQPPLNAGLILEVHSYKADEDDHITFRRHGGFPYVVLENADGRFLFAGGLHGDVINFGIQQQSVEVFHMMGEVMRREGFPVNCIIRQWNYRSPASTGRTSITRCSTTPVPISMERRTGATVIRLLPVSGPTWEAYWSIWMRPCSPVPNAMPPRSTINCR